MVRFMVRLEVRFMVAKCEVDNAWSGARWSWPEAAPLGGLLAQRDLSRAYVWGLRDTEWVVNGA